MEFLTINEFAKLLKVSRRTVERKIKTGELPFIKIGSQYRICSDWIDKIVHKEQSYKE